jgi:hypothetical protein
LLLFHGSTVAVAALIWVFFLLLPTVSEVWLFDLGFFFFAALLPTVYEVWIFVNLVSYFFGLFVSFGGIAVDFLLDFHLN